MVRVCRPGGTVLMTTWSLDGFNGRLFGTIGRHVPPPPPGIQGPPAWGDEDHVREVFAAAGVEVAITRDVVVTTGESVDAFEAAFLENFGPLVIARPMLEQQGKWEPLLADYHAMLEDANTATDGSLSYDAEYMVITATPLAALADPRSRSTAFDAPGHPKAPPMSITLQRPLRRCRTTGACWTSPRNAGLGTTSAAAKLPLTVETRIFLTSSGSTARRA